MSARKRKPAAKPPASAAQSARRLPVGPELSARGYTPEAGRGLERMIEAARQHGEESPDHEVGDLQEIVRACWEYMPAPARAEVCARFTDLVEDFLDADPDNTIELRPEDFQSKVVTMPRRLP